MAKQGISIIDVMAAVDSLRAQGANITQLTVREILGTGSFVTIHKHLKAIREAEERKENVSIHARQANSNTMPDQFEVYRERMLDTIDRVMSQLAYMKGCVRNEIPKK